MGSEDVIKTCLNIYSMCFFYIVGMCVVCSIGGSIIVYVYISTTIVFGCGSLFLICF